MNTDNKIFSLFPAMVLVLIMVTTACKKEHCLDCFKGTGEIVTEERVLGDFGKIILYDRINLNITQDTINSVSIEGGAHIIPYVATEIVDGVLSIRDDNRCNWVRSFKKEINVDLHCKQLFMIEYRGAGAVKSTNTLVSDSVELNFWDGSGCITLDVDCRMVRVHQHTGCGDAELSGKTQFASFYNHGNGQLRCRQLIAQTVDINAQCTNESYLYAGTYLFARIGYVGNVYYAGNPTIESVIIDQGQLIPIE